MIKLEARIKLFDSNDGTVNNAQFNNNNNISWNVFAANSSFGQIVGKEVKQTRPFLLANTPLVGGEDYEIPKNSDMYVLADRVNYFIGSLVSGADGTFPNGASYAITINGADFNAITIVFDKDDEVWPTEVVINGESYTNDDPTFTVGGLGSVDSLDVTITQLNKPNKGLIVTGIYVDTTIVVDEKNLDSFTYSIYDRDSNDEPSYGIVSNSGTLSFIDGTGEILDLLQINAIKGESTVTIDVVNTLTSKKELFVKCVTDKWQYDNDNFVVTVTLKDIIERLQQINFILPFTTSISIDNIVERINTVMPNNMTLVFDESTKDEIDSMLNSNLNNVYYDAGSVWDVIQNLCVTFNLKCYSKYNSSGNYDIIMEKIQ